MSNEDRERQRIARLRDLQLQARNPRKADQQMMRKVARRRQRRYRRVTLREMIRDIPHKWRDAIIGVVVGVGVSLVLPLLWQNKWAEIIGLMAIVVLALLGIAVGQAFDIRDELRDFSRRR